MKYVLITPAHNEERFIPKTLESMAAQTLLPERWIIVNDGSIDKTADIAAELCAALSMDPGRSPFTAFGSAFWSQGARL